MYLKMVGDEQIQKKLLEKQNLNNSYKKLNL